MTALQATTGEPWRAGHGAAPGLKGITGAIALQVRGARAGVLRIEDGAAEIMADGEAVATVMTDDQPTLLELLGGQLHPVVAYLQGRLQLSGDLAQALRILMGLQAGSPWSTGSRGS